MKLPKKISPDRIKEAVVEIKYTSNVPFEVIIGLVFKALDDTYTYTDRPIDLPDLQGFEQKGILLDYEKQYFFLNSKIKLELKPNSLIFTCLKQYSYISWLEYLPEIINTMDQIHNSGAFENFIRVGTRFISEYPNIDLNNCVKFSFSFGLPDVSSSNYSFKTEFEYLSNRVILRFNNKLGLFSIDSYEPVTAFISQIDIDVLRVINVKSTNLEELFENLNSIHDIEKEIFFSVLKDDFLNSLNPEY